MRHSPSSPRGDRKVAQESPQPEIIGNLPQPPILMCAGPGHMVVYARNKARIFSTPCVEMIRIEAMLAWGNQSCGRLGLQEKKMEKALGVPPNRATPEKAPRPDKKEGFLLVSQEKPHGVPSKKDLSQLSTETSI